MASQKSNSKKPRRNPHSGRSRGSEIKTGNRGARKSPMGSLFLVLNDKGLAKSLSHKRDVAAREFAQNRKKSAKRS